MSMTALTATLLYAILLAVGIELVRDKPKNWRSR